MMQDCSIPGLYIHVPFCLSRCAYCDFFSDTDTGLIPHFLDALLSEIHAYGEALTKFDTVYLGGGTPSLLSVGQIQMVMDAIRAAFTILPNAEVTIEVNPADLDPADLKALVNTGINRINIGVQSLDGNELTFLGRRHTVQQAIRSLEHARHAGFENIGMDLIYGLPGQSLNTWFTTLSTALTFKPSHLSCYELEIKAGTPLEKRHACGEFTLHTEETLRDFFMQTSEFLEDAGYIHYEVSNFSSSTETQSRHNSKYWDHTPYLGLGPSAHSFNDEARWWNHESVAEYCTALGHGRLPVAGSEKLDCDQMRLEALFLGLRMKRGIDLARYKRMFGADLLAEKGHVLSEWAHAGLIEITGGAVRPTRAGMAVADALALL